MAAIQAQLDMIDELAAMHEEEKLDLLFTLMDKVRTQMATWCCTCITFSDMTTIHLRNNWQDGGGTIDAKGKDVFCHSAGKTHLAVSLTLMSFHRMPTDDVMMMSFNPNPNGPNQKSSLTDCAKETTGLALQTLSKRVLR